VISLASEHQHWNNTSAHELLLKPFETAEHQLIHNMAETEKPASEKGVETTTATTDNNLSVPPVRPSNERQETGLLDNIPITPASELPPTRAQRNVHFEEEEEEAPPPRPARPTSPNTQNLATLIEAFPDIDTKIVKAVLTASGGQVEPAFNALLGELGWEGVGNKTSLTQHMIRHV